METHGTLRVFMGIGIIYFTLEKSFTCVAGHGTLYSVLFERCLTQFILKWSFASVDAHLSLQIIILIEYGIRHFRPEWPFTNVRLFL